MPRKKGVDWRVPHYTPKRRETPSTDSLVVCSVPLVFGAKGKSSKQRKK